uniref:CUB domain-containing protein n=1 Tax=Ascaris lumbricoides TaxID=6252 RepID=A0A0M3HYP7_ASCLU
MLHLKCYILSFILIVVFWECDVESVTTNCSFYCFTIPKKNQIIDITLYRSLNCTHFVYGFATVTSDNHLQHATFNDLPTYTEQGNYRIFAK